MIRRLKGLYMFFMYVLFALGIGLMLILVVPPMALVSMVGRAAAIRYMEAVQRFCMGFWLLLLRAGGLLATDPPEGRPVEGPSVIVANHPGVFDVLVLIRDVPALSVLVKRSLVRTLPLGPILRMTAYVVAPDPEDVATVKESLDDITGQLRAGRRFMLFPEGRRSPKWGLMRFRPGAFKIAQRAGVPIQPVLIRNDPPFLPREDRWYLPPRRCSRIRLEYLDPIPPPPRGGEAAASRALESRYRELLGISVEPA